MNEGDTDLTILSFIILKTPENFFAYKKINDLGGDAPHKINDLQTFPEFSVL